MPLGEDVAPHRVVDAPPDVIYRAGRKPVQVVKLERSALVGLHVHLSWEGDMHGGGQWLRGGQEVKTRGDAKVGREAVTRPATLLTVTWLAKDFS